MNIIITTIHNEKYKNKSNGKVAKIISDKAAGMCQKTLGITMFVFQYENYDYPFVMEYREFYETHSEV